MEGDHYANGRRFPEASSQRSRRFELVGARKNGRARARHASLPLARLFFLAPTTSKRLLRRQRGRFLSLWIKFYLS